MSLDSPQGTSGSSRANSGSLQATFAATLVDEWVRAGITDAVVCPGSRSTPLVLALAARPELAAHVRLDERSAGFFALGLALATGRPSLLCTTSGTAAAELHPSVVEAHYARVPLVVCTADRPPELHHAGAPQTIDQTHLYGNAVRWFAAPGVADEAGMSWWRALGARAVVEASAGPHGPGPVHLNLAFREPLTGETGPLPPGREDGGPWCQVRWPPAVGASGVAGASGAGVATGVADEVHRWVGRRGVVIAGAGCGDPEAVLGLARRLGWPVLADPRSRCRTPDRAVVGAADSFLRDGPLGVALCPEIVLSLGASWTSKVVAGWIRQSAEAGADVVVVDPWWRWTDPDHVVGVVYRSDPARWLQAAIEGLPGAGREDPGDPGVSGVSGHGGAPPDWLERWQLVEAAAQRALDAGIAADAARRADGLSEPAVARRVLSLLPPGASLVVASSMPVRDLEWYTPALAEPPVVLANRGANGIDGVSSTALGVAGARGAGPVVGLLGDLAFLHDVSALVQPGAGTEAGTGAGSCTLVVLDNGGGGIFSFLHQADGIERESFEMLFATPQAASVPDVARGFALPVTEVHNANELSEAIDRATRRQGLSVICVELPDRAQNVSVHDRLHRLVYQAVRAMLDEERPSRLDPVGD